MVDDFEHAHLGKPKRENSKGYNNMLAIFLNFVGTCFNTDYTLCGSPNMYKMSDSMVY